MKKFIKIVLVFGAVALLAAGCHKTQPQTPSQPVTQSQPQIQQTKATSTQPVITPKASTQVKQKAGQGEYYPGGNPGGIPAKSVPSVVSNMPQEITVYETVDGSSLNQPSYQIIVGATAFDLLQMTHGNLSVKQYGGAMGNFVESIDNIKPDSQHFWAMYVNGQSSNVGASNYKLQAGDKIEWKLEAISSSGQ